MRERTSHERNVLHACERKIGDELADVFIYLCSLANRYGIDLEAAIRAKEEINKTRVWRGQGAG